MLDLAAAVAIEGLRHGVVAALDRSGEGDAADLLMRGKVHGRWWSEQGSRRERGCRPGLLDPLVCALDSRTAMAAGGELAGGLLAVLLRLLVCSGEGQLPGQGRRSDCCCPAAMPCCWC